MELSASSISLIVPDYKLRSSIYERNVMPMEISQFPTTDEGKTSNYEKTLELPIQTQSYTNLLHPQTADISGLKKLPKKSPSAVSLACLMNDCVRKVDFVLVFEKEKYKEGEKKSKNQKIREYFHDNLKREGLNLEFEEVDDSNKILTFVKIHAPWHVTCRMAELLKFNMPLWICDVPMTRKQSWLAKIWHTLWLCKCYGKKLDKRQVYNNITLTFNEKNMDRYAITDKNTFFTNKQRIEIVWDILQSTRSDDHDDKKKGVERLLEKGVYETAFPLHEGRYENDDQSGDAAVNTRFTSRQKLTRRWATWSAFFRPQPLDRIRNYFGEKIGFYFAFMDFYVKMLIFPTVMGIIAFIYGMSDNTDDDEIEMVCSHHEAPGIWYYCPICQPPGCEAWLIHHEGCSKYKWEYRIDNEATMTLSYCTMLWAIIFLKFWKRRESTLATEWDTFDVQEEDSSIRPEFARKAPTQWKNPVTLNTEPHMPFSWRVFRMLISILITLLILCLDGVCLVILLFCRITLYGTFRHVGGFLAEQSVEYARWTVHGLLFLMILFFERIYHYLAHKLTSLECPRTHSSFTSSLLWKLFIFQMLNEFVPIWYAAFLKGKTIRTPLELNFITEMCDGACTSEVTELVAILLLLRLGVQNIVELAVPLIKKRFTHFRAHSKQERSHQPQWLRDYHLNEVELDGVYEDYMEMMIQFAFIMLFIPAFPLAPLVCLLNNILEIRIDGIKILRTRRRPIPIRVSSIATWNRFLEIIVKLSVICNAAFLSFTSDILGRLYYKLLINTKSHNLEGYAKWGMTSINTADWGHAAEEMLEQNITTCVYPDFRNTEPPYELKSEYWSILVIRLIHFIVYIILFYGLMWLINICVDDIPHDVAISCKRKRHVVMKSLEAEGHLGKTHYYHSAKMEYMENWRKSSNFSNASSGKSFSSTTDPMKLNIRVESIDNDGQKSESIFEKL